MNLQATRQRRRACSAVRMRTGLNHSLIATTLLAFLAACGDAPPPADPAEQSDRPEPADLIIDGGRVYSLAWGEPGGDGEPAADAPRNADGWHPDAEAVAIRGGRIVFVGTSADAAAYRGPNTSVAEVGDATVLPGLVDSHTHIFNLGAKLSRVDLYGVETEEEAVARVVEAARDVPAGDWIVGQGWDEGAWANRYPDMRLLSERVPDHPVYLRSLHSFAGWGNALAFQRGHARGSGEATLARVPMA